MNNSHENSVLCVLQLITGLAQAQSFLGPDAQLAPTNRRTGACNNNEFLEQALKLHAYRTNHLISEKQFCEDGIGARHHHYRCKKPRGYRECHVVGSLNLPFTDFTADKLKRHIPTKETKILIYCRNNIEDAAAKRISSSLPFVEPKTVLTGLNIPTFITLVSYGYDNIWELDDIVDPKSQKLTSKLLLGLNHGLTIFAVSHS